MALSQRHPAQSARDDALTRPFFFNETVNGESYLNLLQEFVGPQITEMFGEDSDIYFQQDGAPPHYHRDVRAYLDAVFPDTWIGRRGPIEYPAFPRP
ncbi:hypothetical protein O3P69_010768 [Scylla paramamosain]|uniref:Transposase n=1 Tax=Scylla paramamosain TaxID=85552 RepID=A0AAW0TI58_SCYPA